MTPLGFVSLQSGVLTARPRFTLQRGNGRRDTCCVRMDAAESSEEQLTKKQTRKRIQRQDMFKRLGFEENKKVAEQAMEESYSAEIMREFRANEFTVQRGQITWKLAKAFGFCWGVERAVSQAFQAVDHFPDRKIWITNEIIHNPTVNEEMADRGVEFVPVVNGEKDFSGVDHEDVVVLPAFGATLEEMELLSDKAHSIVDTTCPYVSNVWRAMDDHQRKNVTSIVHGKYKHEETIATVSFGTRYLVVLNMDEAQYVCDYILNGGDKAEFMEKFKYAMSEGFDPDVDLKAVGIANQTTMLKSETAAIGKLFERTMMKVHDEKTFQKSFVATDTICNATQERQDAMTELLTDDSLDMLIVVGGFNSSNTSHLQEMAEHKGFTSYWIDRADRVLPGNKIWARTAAGEERLVENFLSKGPLKIGLTSGASSPDSAVEATIERISLTHSLL